MMRRVFPPHRLRHAAWLLALLAVGGAGFMWLWNVIGHDLFAAPEAQFRHGLAAMVVYLLLSRASRFRRRRFSHSHRQRENIP
jgi:hypothetical protein